MPRANGTMHTTKQQRQAKHIEDGYAKKGMPTKRRTAIAWATVNKQEHESSEGASKAERKPRQKQADAGTGSKSGTTAASTRAAKSTSASKPKRPRTRQSTPQQPMRQQTDTQQPESPAHDGDHLDDFFPVDPSDDRGPESPFPFSVE